MAKTGEEFEKLVDVVAKLRDPNGGCPWDLEQTHQTLKQYVVEEAYEVVDAIDKGPTELKGELGDLLLQVVLHSQIGRDEKTFTVDDVVETLREKLIKRHPHVFGEVKAETSKEVLKNWEKIKEKDLDRKKSILDGVPSSMPALLKAQRISEKAARVGFEWPELSGIRDQILDEVREFVEASVNAERDPKAVEDEFGDIFFSLIQLARRLNFNAEDLMNRSTAKFVRRFKRMEELSHKAIGESTLDELNNLWKTVKKEE